MATTDGKSRSLALRAVEALDKGETEDSLRAALEAVELSLQDPTSRVVLSRVFYELGLHALAAREISEVLPLLKDKRVAEQLLSQLSGGTRGGSKTAASSSVHEVMYAEAELQVDDLEELDKETKAL